MRLSSHSTYSPGVLTCAPECSESAGSFAKLLVCNPLTVSAIRKCRHLSHLPQLRPLSCQQTRTRCNTKSFSLTRNNFSWRRASQPSWMILTRSFDINGSVSGCEPQG